MLKQFIKLARTNIKLRRQVADLQRDYADTSDQLDGMIEYSRALEANNEHNRIENTRLNASLDEIATRYHVTLAENWRLGVQLAVAERDTDSGDTKLAAALHGELDSDRCG